MASNRTIAVIAVVAVAAMAAAEYAVAHHLIPGVGESGTASDAAPAAEAPAPSADGTS